MDVIYPVKPGDDNEALRFSLRSLVNFPHDHVWIVGHKPAWVTGVEFIPGNFAGYHANVYGNIRIACEHPDVADEIIVMNDDFVITEPVERVQVFYRGTLTDHLDIPRVKRGGWWKDSLTTTMIYLQANGIAEPISYELHVPFPADKTQMAQTLAQFQHVTPANPPQWRTLYGNMYHVGGKQHQDVKAYHGGALHRPFHSTEPRSFSAFREQLTEMFPEPSRYERMSVAA